MNNVLSAPKAGALSFVEASTYGITIDEMNSR